MKCGLFPRGENGKRAFGFHKERKMAYNQAIDTYKKTAVETADPLQLIIMCYEGAVRDLQDAKTHHGNHDMDQAYDRIRHAQDIITELLIALDYEKGGEIAVNLGQLYNFILRKLIGVNSRNETTVYDPLIKILSDLKESWEQIRPQVEQNTALGRGRSWQATT